MADNERDWRLYEREYDNLDDHRIEEILDDTGRDSPASDYTDAEVYALAREVAHYRSEERARRKWELGK